MSVCLCVCVSVSVSLHVCVCAHVSKTLVPLEVSCNECSKILLTGSSNICRPTKALFIVTLVGDYKSIRNDLSVQVVQECNSLLALIGLVPCLRVEGPKVVHSTLALLHTHIHTHMHTYIHTYTHIQLIYK